MKSIMKRSAVVILPVAVMIFSFGCATPHVKYYDQDNADENHIRFALLASRVTVAMPASAEDGRPGEKRGDALDKKRDAIDVNMQPQSASREEIKMARIIVTPTEAKDTLRYIRPQNTWISKTNISITYFDSLNVPKTIGVKVEDNSVKLITALGAVGGAAAALMTGVTSDMPTQKSENKITLPIVIDYFSDPSVFMNFGDNENFGKENCIKMDSPNDAYGFCYKIKPRRGRERNVNSAGKSEMVMPVYTDFFNNYKNTYTPNVPFSRCADLIVYIKEWRNVGEETAKEKPIATFSTIIADPYHVDWLPLPQNGSITYQGSCDANSSTEKSDSLGAFDILESAAKQIDSVWKAWHAK